MKRLSVFLLAMLMLLSASAGLAEVVFPLSEPMEFTVVVKQGAQDMSTDYGGTKPAYGMLSDKTNVKINWMPFKGSTYAEKVVQMIGGNDLPDAFAGGSLDVLNNYEIYVDLLPYMEEYMPNWNNYLNNNPLVKDYLTFNGGIYCLPVAAPADPRVGYNVSVRGVIYINDTFCNEYLGGKAPTTMDEFYQALKIAKENDINGNGLGDEIPLLACDNYKQLNFFNYFGMANSSDSYMQYTGNGNEVEFIANKDAFKETLKLLNKWYTEGLINSDVYSMTYDDFATRFNADSSMIAFCVNSWPDMSFADGLSNWTPIVYLDNPGYENVVVNQGSFECLEGMAITTACENPEVLMAFIDEINADFEMWAQWRYGNKGEIWDYADDGYHYYTYLMGPALETGLAYGKYRQTYSMHLFGLSYGGIYEDRKLEDPATEVKGAGRAWIYKTLDEMIDPATVKNAVLRYGFWDEDLSIELDEMNLAINTFVDSFKANAIVKGFTDADWDKYCSDLEKKLDLEHYIELFNAYMTRHD